MWSFYWAIVILQFSLYLYFCVSSTYWATFLLCASLCGFPVCVPATAPHVVYLSHPTAVHFLHGLRQLGHSRYVCAHSIDMSVAFMSSFYFPSTGFHFCMFSFTESHVCRTSHSTEPQFCCTLPPYRICRCSAFPMRLNLLFCMLSFYCATCVLQFPPSWT